MRRRARRSALTNVVRSVVHAALVVLATGAALASVPARAEGSRVAIQDPALRLPGDTLVRRRFAHLPHDDLPCRGCHGAGAAHRTTRVQTPRDCAACHHDPARALACATCHRADNIPVQRTVRLTLNLQVSDTARSRDVAFRHDVHVATSAGLACTDCHATEVTLQRNRDCGSCHASHHAGKAECATCHAAPRRDAHNDAVHLTCAGSGCHAASTAPTPVLSRTLCLFCHADRRDHEPEGSCAACHLIPGANGRALSRAARHAGQP